VTFFFRSLGIEIAGNVMSLNYEGNLGYLLGLCIFTKAPIDTAVVQI
jgi:hypothetical protein